MIYFLYLLLAFVPLILLAFLFIRPQREEAFAEEENPEDTAE